MFCKYCGEKIPIQSPFCTKCGRRQPDGAPPIQTAFPLKPDSAHTYNSRAFFSYYIAISSFVIPFIFSIPAVICGISGLLYEKEYPNARDRKHAWAGIVIGLLSAFFWWWLIHKIIEILK